MRVVITAEAEADFEMVFDYIAEDSPAIALRFVNTLRKRALNIGHAPKAYPARPDLGAGIRASYFRSYVTLFRIEVDRVEILHIVHGARDLKRLIEG